MTAGEHAVHATTLRGYAYATRKTQGRTGPRKAPENQATLAMPERFERHLQPHMHTRCDLLSQARMLRGSETTEVTRVNPCVLA